MEKRTSAETDDKGLEATMSRPTAAAAATTAQQATATPALRKTKNKQYKNKKFRRQREEVRTSEDFEAQVTQAPSTHRAQRAAAILQAEEEIGEVNSSNEEKTDPEDIPGAYRMPGINGNDDASFHETIENSAPMESRADLELIISNNNGNEAEGGTNLVVANLVPGPAEATILPQNEQKTGRQRHRQQLLIFVLVIAVAAAIAIALALILKREPTSTIPAAPTTSVAPSAAPTTEFQHVMIFLASIFPDLPSSEAQSQALDWLQTEHDSTVLRNEMPHKLLERFVLTIFYFSLRGDKLWLNEGLWTTPRSPCHWVDIHCHGGQIVEIGIYFRGLEGTIPTELGAMTSLRDLWLYDNGLTGTIPTELGLLTSLTRLDLEANSLTGTIPSELGAMTSLRDLYLDDNGLTGTIPSELGLLTSLRWLSLGSNALTGTIPTELGLLTSLTWLYLENNNLSGSVPTGLIELLESLHPGRCYLGGNPNLIGTPSNCQGVS